MRVFKNYLEEKLSDPIFKQAYSANCSVCRTTVAIAAALIKQGLSYEEAAERSGVSAHQISDLVSADRCDPDSVRKLCIAFDIAVPVGCEKTQADSLPE
jgi:hypothetical protein